MRTRLPTALALLTLLLTPVPALDRARRRRRCGPDHHRVSAHRYRSQLVSAADRTIADARRGPAPGAGRVVTVRDVQRRAYRDFGLRSVPEEYAGRVLRERLAAHGGPDAEQPPR